MRPDTYFSNGEPLTAEAVKVTFEKLMTDDANGFSWQREVQASYSRVDIVDDLTVAIHTVKVDILTPGLLSGLYIVPPRYLTDVGYQGLQDEPVGSGPFVVDAWRTARVSLSANRTSWHPPKVDRMDLLVVPDSSARYQALITGQIDVAIAINTDQIGLLEQAGHRVHLRTPNRIMVMARQSVDPGSPFHDERCARP